MTDPGGGDSFGHPRARADKQVEGRYEASRF